MSYLVTFLVLGTVHFATLADARNFGGFDLVFPLGPITTATVNGAGVSHIASGTTVSRGSGSTLTSDINSGQAAVSGISSTAVQGFGPAAGQVSVGGTVSVQNPLGGTTASSGNAAAGFSAGDGPSSGQATTTFKGFSNPTATGGISRAHSESTG